MEHKFLGFHLEPSKALPSGDWRAISPLGIACAAVCASDTGGITAWYGQTSDGAPTSQMTQDEVKAVVESLSTMTGSEGYTLVTWNGLRFDLPILGEESGLITECKSLARRHVDMMFHLLCAKGYCPDLDVAALGMGLPGKIGGAIGLLQRSALIGLGSASKTADVESNDISGLWNQGNQQHVLDYLAQDVRIMVDLAIACQDRRTLKWISNSYDELEIPLPKGWLVPEEAVTLQEPDAPGIDSPAMRREFMDWLDT